MKKYKFIRNIGFCLCALVAFSACEKVLNEEPFSQLSDEKFWQTDADAEAGVLAIYDAMQKTYTNKYFQWGELRSDNFDPTATSTAGSLELLRNNLQASNSGVLRWNNFYLMIARANLAISKIPKIPGYNKNLLAEALLLRAYAYFDGIRVWGGLPLFTEAVQGLNQELRKPKTDGTKILNEVIVPGMLEAEKLMSKNTDPFRISRASIWAFQAQVYMYQKDYAKAKVALDKIVNLKTYTLTTTRDAWAKMFLNDLALGGKFMTGTELMFSIRYELTEDADRSGVYAVHFAGVPNYYLSRRLETKWTARFPVDSNLWKAKYPSFAPKTVDVAGRPVYGDWRFIESKEQGRALGLSRLAKYSKANYNSNFDNSNIHVFRYADIILMLAEAENQLNNTTAALALLNQIRDARQLPRAVAADFTDKASLEELILDERQMELIGEGKRWWDLIRTGKAVQVMNPINGQTDQRLLFPIFQDHLIDNPLLTQTPGYN
ncbi:MAG: RagB/SusD family nutrient uptake outer membrane protein [Saprospiraceae bacterium]|nr:RagB/SusD family nutrient uptake outer membrane protein [Saprospiraceae bacterium]